MPTPTSPKLIFVHGTCAVAAARTTASALYTPDTRLVIVAPTAWLAPEGLPSPSPTADDSASAIQWALLEAARWLRVGASVLLAIPGSDSDNSVMDFERDLRNCIPDAPFTTKFVLREHGNAALIPLS